ncbi:MAG: hypothetical protein AAF961_09015, partial [Planctomycetota bacterium]
SGPSDGVVPVSSARLYGVASETFVDAEHSCLQRDDRTILATKYILCAHLRSFRASRASAVTAVPSESRR